MLDESKFLARITSIFQGELDQDDLSVTMTTSKDDLEGWDSWLCAS